MVGCGVVQKGQLKSHLFPSNILAEAISMTHSDMLYWLDISTFYLSEPLLFQIFDPWKFIKAGLCLSSIPFYSQQPRSIKSVSHFLSLHIFLSMQNIGRSIRSRQLFFSDVVLVSNYHGCKGETINLIPHCLIDIVYKTVKPLHLEKLQNHTKYK